MAPKHTDCRWGEWHHLAAVTTGREMRLYIDGRLWQNKTLVASIAELRAPNMKIGAGFDGGPLLLSLFVLLSVVLSLIEVFRRKREAGGPKR